MQSLQVSLQSLAQMDLTPEYRKVFVTFHMVLARLFPVLPLSEQQEIDLGHGKRLEVGEDRKLSDGTDRAKLAAAIAPSGRLVGLVEVKNGRTRVVTNFPTAEAGSGAPAVPSANAGAGSEPTA